MDTNTQEQYTPEETAHMPSSPESPEKGSWGSTIGIILIVAVIVIGGLYFWGQKIDERLSEYEGNITVEDILNAPDASLEAFQEQGTSTDPADIKNELDATNFDNLDAELDAIDTELNK
jgi:uncharacterized protein HemX